MKKILIVILIAIIYNAPIAAQTKCPKGFKYWPGMSTTSLITHSGCYPDSTYNKISDMFFENLCSETGHAFFSWKKNGDFEGSGVTNKWDTGSNICKSREWIYFTKGNIKVDITINEY